MAELLPVHRYAAGALFALALHQAQIHQKSSYLILDDSVLEEQTRAIEAEFEEKDIVLWTSRQCGLLRPIFRYLKLEQITWAGLEQTALSSDAHIHIGAFLRILSENEQDPASSSHNVQLAEAVDTVALNFKEDLPSGKSHSNVEELSSSKSLSSGVAKHDENPTGKLSTHTLPSAGAGEETFAAPAEKQALRLHLLQEDYFGSSSTKSNNAEPCGDENTGDMSTQEHAGWVQSPTKILEKLFLSDSLILEGARVTQQRKVAVLYELLSAAVADLPPEEAEDGSRVRRGYDARQRVALRLLATWLDVKWTKMAAMELLVAYAAMAAQEDVEANKDAKESGSKSWAKWKRGGLIGAAAVTGGALLALTGGLAAPAIAAGLSALAPTLGTIMPVIGSAGFAAAAAAAGSTVGSVAVAASFGAAGAGLSGSKMARRTGGVEEFGFEGIGENHQQGRLAVGIVVSGFINDTDDFTKPWKGQDGDLERYALRWETKNLIVVSTAIQDWLTSSISKELMKQGAMLTVLSTLLTALAWPSALLTLTDFIDSKWTIAVDRSDKAGKLLAEVLLKGLQGSRPVTLIGFSLGARVIFKCLEKLAEKGENGRIVERVVLLGAPLTIDMQKWETVRKVVAGRFVNAYSSSDWLLAVVYRASLMSQGLAGIQAVKVPGIENVDITDMINGHSSYLLKLGEILEAINIDSYFPMCLESTATNKEL